MEVVNIIRKKQAGLSEDYEMKRMSETKLVLNQIKISIKNMQQVSECHTEKTI